MAKTSRPPKKAPQLPHKRTPGARPDEVSKKVRHSKRRKVMELREAEIVNQVEEWK